MPYSEHDDRRALERLHADVGARPDPAAMLDDHARGAAQDNAAATHAYVPLTRAAREGEHEGHAVALAITAVACLLAAGTIALFTFLGQ